MSEGLAGGDFCANRLPIRTTFYCLSAKVRTFFCFCKVLTSIYSFFSSTAGFVFAAFNVCHSTVPKAMAREMMTATTNTQP